MSDIREKLRALSRTDKFDPRYPIDAYEDDLVALIEQEVLKARIEELSNLKAEKGRFSTSSYGLWVDGAIDNRIVELEAQLENK